MSFLELFFIIALVLVVIFILYLIIGPRRLGSFVGGFMRGMQANGSGQSGAGSGRLLSWVLGIAGLVGGYILGSLILPMLSFNSWERHVVGTNRSGYTSALRGAYSDSAMLGGIVGAIIFLILGLVLARILSRKSS